VSEKIWLVSFMHYDLESPPGSNRLEALSRDRAEDDGFQERNAAGTPRKVLREEYLKPLELSAQTRKAVREIKPREGEVA
jgi:hypothetical protein